MCGLCLFALLDRSFIALSVLAAVALHEGTHLLAMRLYGVHVRRLELLLYGVRLDCNLGILPPARRAAVYLCAPLLNLTVGFAALLAYPGALFGMLNLCLGLFNLLPVPPLDGGNAARVLFSSRRSALLQRAAALVCLLPLFSLALWLIRESRNYTLLFCTVYLLVCTLGRDARPDGRPRQGRPR